MNSALQERADAANDSYNNRSQGDVGKQTEVSLDGQKYQVFGYANDPISGFHATAYQRADKPHNIIIAYRGTDPGLFSGKTHAEKVDHVLTTVQDIAVDATMVRDTVNPQKSTADAFTAAMIEKAAQQGIPKDQITVAGHSLGGTLAEIEAAKYGLTGSTYNAYGAAGLTDGPPQPGTYLTNYRMAGDVVSAANPHIGKVVSLASKDDIQSLRDGRYLDAPAGAPPPNTLIAMRLGDHGGQQNFGSKSPDNLLVPDRFQEAAQHYADNKAAFDRFSSDVSRERGELSQALKQMQGRYDQNSLPPDIRRQVNEYLALHADQPVRHAIEQSGIAQGAEHTLQQGADAARISGHYVQAQSERVASTSREVGNTMWPVNPAAPLVGAVIGEVAHLHGQAADATGHFVGDRLQSTKGAVEQGAHNVAQAVVGKMHDPGVQAAVANVVNHGVNAYHDVQATAQAVVQTYEATKHAVSQGVENTQRAAARTYEATKQTVRHGINAAEHAAGQTYDTLTHPGQWFHHDASAAAAQTSHIASPHPPHTQAITPTDPGYSHNDPRHPGNPQHGLFQELKERIPAAGENRLLQFTAVCHANKITEHNLDKVGLNHQEGTIIFIATGAHVASVDVKQPSPQPEQSIQQIQRYDQQQAANNTMVQAHMAQNNQQGMQGSWMGGQPSPGGLGF